MDNNENYSIKVNQNRRIGYSEYGDKAGYPIFYFHGFPGSRFEGGFFDDIAKNSNIRIIAVDRPGMGLSDIDLNRSMLDFPKDVIVLADHLKIERFCVLGISGGGPYVAACAYSIPKERLLGGAIISGMGPIEAGLRDTFFSFRLLLWIAGKHSKLLYFLMWLYFRNRYKGVKRAYKSTLKDIEQFSKEDKECFKDNRLIDIFTADNRGGFVQGIKGEWIDAQLYGKPWGFKIEDISTEIKIYLWHGLKDEIIPVKMGKYLASKIPNCEAKFYPDEGHFSAAYNNVSEILSRIKSFFE